MRKPPPSLVMVIVIALVITGLIMLGRSSSPPPLTFVEFEQQVERQQVQSPVIIKTRDRVIEGTLVTGTPFSAGYTEDFALTTYLQEHGLDFRTDPQTGSVWGSLLPMLLPTILMLLVLFLFLGSRQKAPTGPSNLLKARTKKLNPGQPQVRFSDVAGVDEAVEELQEIKAFLASPAKFRKLGAKIPTGVLLYGSPGTGKTLLARAVAGEAGVPFFSISGSDFVEMYVGVGAGRVRDLFQQAKENQPSIIFIDEIDAVGRQRGGGGMGGGNDEREQTLNQLLVEMDGFEPRDNVIVMAGTNRPDILDPALLRPGRFDRQVLVDRPDRSGRKAILEVHARDKPLADDVDIERIAAQTPGFTGADLASLVNEAALLAARAGKRAIGQEEIEEATLRVLAGPQKRSRILTEHERLITAYHEAGHALVAYYLPMVDPVQRISIISRGQALGLTLTTPSEDRFMMEKQEILNKLAQMLGGRVAEEVTFDDVTTGAASDLRKATETARRMVTEFGMSEEIGLVAIGKDASQQYAGRELAFGQDYSDKTAELVDREIGRLIDIAHDRAETVLKEHRDKLDLLASTLMEKETVDRAQFEALLKDGASEPWGEAAQESPAATLSEAPDGAVLEAPDGAILEISGGPAPIGDSVGGDR